MTQITRRSSWLLVLSVLLLVASLARAQNVSAAKQRSRDRADYNTFKHQIIALKEFAEEKKKVSKLIKDNHVPVKVLAVVDSSDSGDDDKNGLKGYICQQIGENSSNIYEISFDRAQKKITAVKKTGEGDDPEVQEKEPKEKKTTAHAKPKKDKDDEDDDDGTDDDKPAKGKPKAKDKDSDDE